MRYGCGRLDVLDVVWMRSVGGIRSNMDVVC